MVRHTLYRNFILSPRTNENNNTNVPGFAADIKQKQNIPLHFKLQRSIRMKLEFSKGKICLCKTQYLLNLNYVNK